MRHDSASAQSTVSMESSLCSSSEADSCTVADPGIGNLCLQELAAGSEGARPAAGLEGHLRAVLNQAGFAEELQLIAKAGIRSHSPFLDSCLARALDHAEVSALSTHFIPLHRSYRRLGMLA